MRLRAFAAGFVGLLAAACATYAASSGDEPRPDGGGGDDAGDSAPERSASGDGAGVGDAAPEAAPNILPNGDFEVGCASWSSAYGTLSEDGTAHSGVKSCRVCAPVDDGGGASLDMSSQAAVEVAPGDRWVASAWVRRPPDAPGPPKTELNVFAFDTAGGSMVFVDQAYTTGPATSDSWQRVSAVFVAKSRATLLSVRVFGSAPTAACMLIDDVSLSR